VALQVKRVIGDAVSGAMDVADRDLILCKGLASEQKDIQSDLKKLGDLVSLTWAGRLDLN